MPLDDITYTLWPGLYRVDEPQVVTESWDALVLRFSTHRVITDKSRAPGFSPAVLVAPPADRPCLRHPKVGPKRIAHRCDSCVAAVTFLAFDADQGDEAAVAKCDAALGAAGLARLWYSSHSYSPVKSSYRLLVPLSKPVDPRQFRWVRDGFIRSFAVPASFEAASALSNFFYAPSCPPGATPVVRAFGGAAFVPVVAARMAPRPRTFVIPEYEPPEDPVGPLDLAPARAELEKRVAYFKRRDADKARWLRRCIDGEALAEHGERNRATFVTAGVVAHALPGRSLRELREIMAGSVEAMEQAGSSVSVEDVDRMLISAMHNRYLADAERKAYLDVFAKLRTPVVGRDS